MFTNLSRPDRQSFGQPCSISSLSIFLLPPWLPVDDHQGPKWQRWTRAERRQRRRTNERTERRSTKVAFVSERTAGGWRTGNWRRRRRTSSQATTNISCVEPIIVRNDELARPLIWSTPHIRIDIMYIKRQFQYQPALIRTFLALRNRKKTQ